MDARCTHFEVLDVADVFDIRYVLDGFHFLHVLSVFFLISSNVVLHVSMIGNLHAVVAAPLQQACYSRIQFTKTANSCNNVF